MTSKPTSKGVCPVCKSEAWASNPIWISRYVSDGITAQGSLVSRDPYHQACFVARELGLTPGKEG